MAKPTRRQRQSKHSKKPGVFNRLVTATVAASIMLVTTTAMAAETEPVPEPVPVLIVALASEAPVNDRAEQPLGMDDTYPEGRSPEGIRAAIIEMDQARSLDRRFRDYLNQRWFTEDDVMNALYYVTFAQFLQRYGRIAPVRSDLRDIGGVFLTDLRGRHSSTAGEELWSRFRYRMRREGALVRICNNEILPNNSASGPRLRVASRAA